MVTYIKKSIPERFLTLETELDAELYNIGDSLEDYNDGAWVALSEEQATFHEENPSASVDEVWDIELTDRSLPLEVAVEIKCRQIDEYDQSKAVNSFTLDGMEMWLDKATRVGLANSIGIEKAMGREVTAVWYGNSCFSLPIDTAQRLLAAVELYALECYNVTASHKATVRVMTDVREVKEYDHTIGYPDKLMLNTGIE